MADPGRITALLGALQSGDTQAWHDLAPLVYDQLRAIAGRYVRQERGPDVLIQPSALVHEAYLKLIQEPDRTFQNRYNFFGVCAAIMRRILVDSARRRNAARRGGNAVTFSIDAIPMAMQAQPFDWIELDQALDRLNELSERQRQMIELRFFAGFSLDQTAEALGVTTKTVQRDWNAARAWLWKELRS
ncbi:MAG: ECF-type sigma factor [Paludibaculum sp.]